MSFQSIIDNAANIVINRRPVIAQTITRSGISRAVSRGNNLWKFEVTLPDGPRWQDYRGIVSAAEAKDMLNQETVNFSNPGLDYLFGYQGDQTGFATTTVEVNYQFRDRLIIVNNANEPASGFVFKAGDLIQLAGGRTYTVASNVPAGSGGAGDTILLHRPIVDEIEGNYSITVGAGCQFTLKCISYPEFSIFERNQIAWSGPFIFQEVL